jgi:hypothetical protein
MRERSEEQLVGSVQVSAVIFTSSPVGHSEKYPFPNLNKLVLTDEQPLYVANGVPDSHVKQAELVALSAGFTKPS